MIISIIAAMTPGNHVIGYKNELPWRLSSDLKRFKELTLHKPIVMGRLTHESIGRTLPKRTNIVLSTQEGYKAGDGCQVVNSVYEALRLCQGLESNEEVFFIGGNRVFKEAMKVADKMYLTFVLGSFVGDAYFPSIGEDWRIDSVETYRSDEKNEVPYSFVNYSRK